MTRSSNPRSGYSQDSLSSSITLAGGERQKVVESSSPSSFLSSPIEHLARHSKNTSEHQKYPAPPPPKSKSSSQSGLPTSNSVSEARAEHTSRRKHVRRPKGKTYTTWEEYDEIGKSDDEWNRYGEPKPNRSCLWIGEPSRPSRDPQWEHDVVFKSTSVSVAARCMTVRGAWGLWPTDKKLTTWILEEWLDHMKANHKMPTSTHFSYPHGSEAKRVCRHQ